MLGQLGFRGVVFPISIIHCGILEVSVDKYFIQWNCLSRSMVKWIQEHQQMDFDNIPTPTKTFKNKGFMCKPGV
jgi:hypothetical protein